MRTKRLGEKANSLKEARELRQANAAWAFRSPSADDSTVIFGAATTNSQVVPYEAPIKGPPHGKLAKSGPVVRDLW